MTMNSVSLTVRVKITSLAKIAQLIEGGGDQLTTKSDMIWQCVEKVASLSKEPDMRIEDAIMYLDSVGLSVRGNDKVRKQVSRALQAEVLHEDFESGMGGRVDMTTKKKMTAKDLGSDREMYEMAVDWAKTNGMPYPSYEEFLSRKAAPIQAPISDASTSSAQLNRERAAYDADQLAKMKNALGVPPRSAEQTSPPLDNPDT